MIGEKAPQQNGDTGKFDGDEAGKNNSSKNFNAATASGSDDDHADEIEHSLNKDKRKRIYIASK